MVRVAPLSMLPLPEWLDSMGMAMATAAGGENSHTWLADPSSRSFSSSSSRFLAMASLSLRFRSRFAPSSTSRTNSKPETLLRYNPTHT